MRTTASDYTFVLKYFFPTFFKQTNNLGSYCGSYPSFIKMHYVCQGEMKID